MWFDCKTISTTQRVTFTKHTWRWTNNGG